MGSQRPDTAINVQGELSLHMGTLDPIYEDYLLPPRSLMC